MIQHDKHQYYFEKYLRNEMSYHERMAFDEKLAEDKELQEAFKFYKSHRLAMLHELIEEHKQNRKDNRLNKLIFLLISLTGIALTFNYYVLHRTPAVGTRMEKAQRRPLYTYIPFVDWEKRAEMKDARKNERKDDVGVTAVTEEDEEPVVVLEPSEWDDERTITDAFLTDSFIVIHDKAYIERLMGKQNPADSSVLDSLAAVRLRGKEKNDQLFVEFWQSPVHYKGYKLNGKKLILYGIEHPYMIYVYREENTTYLIHPYGETALTEQPKFQPF